MGMQGVGGWVYGKRAWKAPEVEMTPSRMTCHLLLGDHVFQQGRLSLEAEYALAFSAVHRLDSHAVVHTCIEPDRQPK